MEPNAPASETHPADARGGDAVTDLFCSVPFDQALSRYLSAVLDDTGAEACVLFAPETSFEPEQCWTAGRGATADPGIAALIERLRLDARAHVHREGPETLAEPRPGLLFTLEPETEAPLYFTILWPPGTTLPETAAAAPTLQSHPRRLAARLLLRRRLERLQTSVTQYERGFATLDRQLRVLDLERQKLAAVLNSAEVGFLVVGRDGRITWSNPAMALTLNAAGTGHGLVRQACHEVLCGQAQPCPDCPAQRALREGRPGRGEITTSRGAERRRLYTIAAPIRSASGEVEEALLMVQDLTALDVLRRSETRYRLLFESSNDGIFMAAPPDFRIVHANPAMRQMLDQSEAEFQARTLRDLHLADDWPRMQSYYARALQGETTESSDALILDRSGAVHFCSVAARPFDLDGEQVLLCTLRDLTARKQAEDELARSFSLLQGTLESTADGILVLDTAGRVTSYNRKFLEMWGLAADGSGPEDGDRILAAVQAQVPDRTELERLFAQAVASTAPQAPDRIRTSDERIIECHSQPQHIGGITVGRVFSFRDVTERTRAEQNLQGRLQFENLIATLSNHFITLDSRELDRGIETALQRICDFAKVDRSQILLYAPDRRRISAMYAWCRDGVAPHDHPVQDAPVEQLPWIEKRIRATQVIHIPDVETLPPEAGAERERLQAQGIRSLVCVPLVYGRDVLGYVGFESVRTPTAWDEEDIALLHIAGELLANAISRKRIEEEKLSLEEQLLQSQKMEAVGTLAGGIAHDFNNLLTGILGYADLLGTGTLNAEQAAKAAQVIERAARRAAELTQQLLGYARKGKYQNVAIDLHALIGEVTTLLRRAFDKNIVIRHQVSPEPPFIMGDPVQIQQVLMNLAVNARDAMPDGGQLTFETAVVTLDLGDDAGDGTSSPRPSVRLIVADSGCGIPAEVQARIFEPFFTTKEQGKGTGMGLSMVYGIVKNHGGSVCVSSSPGKGTRFELLFPAALPAQVIEKASRRYAQGGSARLLLVDDEDVVRSVATTILERLGYAVITARDGEEALEIYRREGRAIDLVILDMIMPKMGGRECYAQLRQIDPDVRVILSTGYALDEATQKILDQGMRGIAQKPYASDELALAVQNALKP